MMVWVISREGAAGHDEGMGERRLAACGNQDPVGGAGRGWAGLSWR